MIQEEKTVKDFGEGIRKAISNLSRAAEKCMKEFQDFEKRIDYASQPLVFSEGGVIVDKDDWKILDVNCLPKDILVGDYDFQYRNIFPSGCYSTITLNNEYVSKEERISLLSKKYLMYRIAEPKKSHEELAEGYAKKVDKTSSRIFSFEEIVSLRAGFIAGRKSMESE